jgi:hypothetical protein
VTEEWVALAGLRYPDGDDEYEKALAGEECKWRIVEPGQVCVNLPAKSLKAYQKHGREVIAKAEKTKAVKP